MRIIAITYYRFDKDYLDDYQENLSSLCDDFLLVEDSEGGFMYDEGKYRKRLIQRAKEMGADWVVALDPDERLEKTAGKKLRKAIGQVEEKKTMFRLNFRELYTPNAFRVDGDWGIKWRIPIFPLRDDNIFSDQKLHTPKQPLNTDYEIIETDLNIYHLKHIVPALRLQRTELYNRMDPNREYQSIGYDYLSDETGLKLERIPFRRMYRPKYRDYQIDEGIFTIA